MPEAAAAARAFVQAAAEAWELDDVAAVAALLTSELVANAVRHARDVVELTAAHVPPELRVEVCDDGDGSPVVSATDSWSTAGRGLGLVDALADRWGVRPDGEGKAVWFVLAAG